VRLEDIVQHFLTFARLPAPRRQVGDLRDILSQALELIRVRARRQGVEVEVEPAEGPVPVDLDPGLFHQVLVNLLLNALDAMPHGGRLRVAVRPGEDEHCLSIRDSGPGIAPEMMGRLFTPFASTKATGTGLGLSLARRIVEEHGGRVSAANPPGGGACFSITLPRAAAERPAAGVR
jgi:signal transduction histidine kinase